MPSFHLPLSIMAFNFRWPVFSKQFHADAAAMLDSALNRDPKPKVIADDIKVEDIHMGTIPPELDMLEIGELSTDRFRGIFRLTYAGDAHLLLSTKVQANPLTRPTSDGSASPYEDVSSAIPSSMPSRGILFAARPLVVPMQLRLSGMRLKAIVVLVVSKQKGITLVFKNDPLESVEVSSTFDSVAVIQKYLQQEIEGQLREMFREDLPGIIHRLSQRWLSSNNQKKPAPSETPHQSPPTISRTLSTNTPSRETPRHSRANSDVRSLPLSPSKLRTPTGKRNKSNVTPQLSPRVGQRANPSQSGSRPSKAAEKTRDKVGSPIASPRKGEQEMDVGNLSLSSSSGSYGGFGGNSFVHDVQHYDPTYGLRPDDLRVSATSGTYSGLVKLASRSNRGFGDLTLKEEDTSKEAEPTPSNPSISPQNLLKELPMEQSEEDNDDGEEGEEAVLSDQQEFDAYSDDSWSEAGDMDDVPDFPTTDPEAEDKSNSSDEEAPADYTRYGYPPASADFSDTAVEDNARRAHSVFGTSSLLSGSPKAQSIGRGSVSSSRRSVAPSSRTKNRIEFETIPAVGGGTITRPRIYHSASTLQAPDIEEEDQVDMSRMGDSATASSTARGPASIHTLTFQDERETEHEDELDASRTDESPSALGHESLATLEPEPMDPTSRAYQTHIYRHRYGSLYRPGYNRHSSIGSGDFSSVASNSAYARRNVRDLPASGTSTTPTSSYPSTHTTFDGRFSSPSKPYISTSGPRISSHSPHKGSGHAMTLNASNHFMDLVNSNHTLSPFTRTLDTTGYAVRSHPVTPGSGSASSGASSVYGAASLPGRLPYQSRSGTSTPSAGMPPQGMTMPGHSNSSFPVGTRRRTFRLGPAKGEALQSPSKPVASSPDPIPLAASNRHAPRPQSRTNSLTSLDQELGSTSSMSSTGNPGFISRRPNYDTTRRRSSHVLGEAYESRPMGSIRE